MSIRSIVLTVANAIKFLTKILWVVIAQCYKAENDVESTFGGTGLKFQIKKYY